MPYESVGNDVLAERLTGVRDDVQELGKEQQRTRERLHKLEGLTGMLVDEYKRRQGNETRRQRRLEVRISMLTAAVAVVGLLEPFLYHLATGK